MISASVNLAICLKKYGKSEKEKGREKKCRIIYDVVTILSRSKREKESGVYLCDVQ